MLKAQFLSKIVPGAQQAMQTQGILASLTIAQAILESGWGNSAPGNNLFGIKANGWTGKTQILTTKEQKIDGSWMTIKDVFRAYDSWAASVGDHALFLIKNSRYKNLVGCGDYKTACTRIQADGYATAKSYAQSLITLIEANKLYQYDVLPAQVRIETPKAGTTCTDSIKISGWGIAAKGVARIDVYADVKTGLASINSLSERADVQKIKNPFGWYKDALHSGFTCAIPAGKLKKGKHSIDVVTIGKDGGKAWAHTQITVH